MALIDINNQPVIPLNPKCTLRMAVASANLDLAVGGPLMGCAAGSAGSAATNGVVGSGAGRANWAAIRNYLNANCGSTLRPEGNGGPRRERDYFASSFIPRSSPSSVRGYMRFDISC